MSWRVSCPFCRSEVNSKSGAPSQVVRQGWYRRQHDGRRIQRFLCRICKKSFSSLTHKPVWRLQKPYVNQELTFLLCSGLSQRRAARHLRIDPKTVARRLVTLGELARKANLKPVSIPRLVEEKTREIIALRVYSMPAKGILAAKSQKKYGPRKDERREARLDTGKGPAARTSGRVIHNGWGQFMSYRETPRN